MGDTSEGLCKTCGKPVVRAEAYYRFRAKAPTDDIAPRPPDGPWHKLCIPHISSAQPKDWSLRVSADVIAQAHAEYIKALEAAGLGCQSSSCAWWHRGGQVVNGPCRCGTGHLQNSDDAMTLVQRLRAAAYAGSRLARAIKLKTR